MLYLNHQIAKKHVENWQLVIFCADSLNISTPKGKPLDGILDSARHRFFAAHYPKNLSIFYKIWMVRGTAIRTIKQSKIIRNIKREGKFIHLSLFIFLPVLIVAALDQ
ncbi:hypothetical protein [Neobacillus vireti]|uniref:Uncharacterized protein n=1 Tax=Neobacillus vireti LMG 21834 TaxID=1131730 RepID=A0AB94IFJ2_9BACI|nr:hypothetical protein [Neobacillus vireti]ETI65880.1 hypothetical protein BAVI_25479 [Neobacillus vireti LMG 21834]KLT17504.1 hypothetical protein AA980_12845 [Neobacillus vireti]